MTTSKITNLIFLLDWAREVGTSFPFFDCHIHPYDVLACDISYQANSQAQGLFSRGLFPYKAPVLESDNDYFAKNSKSNQVEESERVLLLASRFLYSHTGPKVFADQIDLAGISGALLVPVVRSAGVVDQMLENIKNMFSKDNRFLVGCPFPVGIKRDELGPFFRKAKMKWGICAIKIHPNLADINPLSKTGRELIETTLEIAGNLNLPVVIHGGRTPGLRREETREYGMLSHLKEINWSISSSPVTIAHAGCYKVTEDEVSGNLSVLEKMFEKHSNLFADTSNLELPILRLVLKTVDRKRLMFGSDALYVSIWQAWISFLKVLRGISPVPESDLVQIASYTPIQCLNISTNRS